MKIMAEQREDDELKELTFTVKVRVQVRADLPEEGLRVEGAELHLVRGEGASKAYPQTRVRWTEFSSVLERPQEEKAIIEVTKLGRRSYETWLRIGVQSFRVAGVEDDEEAHDHCVFAAQQLHHALGVLGITAECKGFELLRVRWVEKSFADVAKPRPSLLERLDRNKKER